jgi:hypothetical protein
LIDQTSLPIVLKPKPATVRLEVVDRGGRLLKWMVMVDSHDGSWIVVVGGHGWTVMMDHGGGWPWWIVMIGHEGSWSMAKVTMDNNQGHDR